MLSCVLLESQKRRPHDFCVKKSMLSTLTEDNLNGAKKQHM